MSNWEQCENVYRKGGGRWTANRCSRRAITVVWRVVEKDGKVIVEKKSVCGICANRLMTGRDREPTNPWKRRILE